MIWTHMGVVDVYKDKMLFLKNFGYIQKKRIQKKKLISSIGLLEYISCLPTSEILTAVM